MTEAEVFALLSESIKKNKPCALATIISHAGSTPGKQGSVMAVLADGETCGTVGGGSLELTVIRQAKGCIKTGVDGEFSYSLDGNGMACGGDVRIHIKVFMPAARLIICGGGHIGKKLYELGVMLGFAVYIIDERAEFAEAKIFPNAADVICKDASDALTAIGIDQNCYIAIATHSHETDEKALLAAVETEAAYIGMIGSRKKVGTIFSHLKDAGVSEKALAKVYAPMGLDIASIKTEEIALSIISEIMLVKNSGALRHMKERN